ncbi:MAG: hypothetical protein RJQ08_08380 [Salinisphaeraceae bacterium]
MTDTNIELFNQHAALILSELYRAFPLRQHIEYRILVLGENPSEPNVTETPEVTPIEEHVYDATVDWLSDAGYINLVGNARRGNATLTSKGLETLKAVPATLQGNVSIGDQLVDATKSGTSAAAADIVAKGLTHGFWFLMRSQGG